MGPISNEYGFHATLPSPLMFTRQLALHMVRVRPELEKVKSFFSKKAVFRFDGHSEMDRDQFIESMKTGHFYNVIEIRHWFNTFDHLPGTINGVLWRSVGAQSRLGNGINESGPGLYKLASEVNLTFEDKNGKIKITEFNVVKYVKTKA